MDRVIKLRVRLSKQTQDELQILPTSKFTNDSWIQVIAKHKLSVFPLERYEAMSRALHKMIFSCLRTWYSGSDLT